MSLKVCQKDKTSDRRMPDMQNKCTPRPESAIPHAHPVQGTDEAHIQNDDGREILSQTPFGENIEIGNIPTFRELTPEESKELLKKAQETAPGLLDALRETASEEE